MITKKRKQEIMESIAKLDKSDLYSMLLFTLYKMREIPEYSALSELSYILDNDNLTKLLAFYGGMTIRIPTLEELRLVTQALVLYQYVNIENGDLEEGLNVISNKEFKISDLLETYQKIVEVVRDYDFDRTKY